MGNEHWDSWEVAAHFSTCEVKSMRSGKQNSNKQTQSYQCAEGELLPGFIQRGEMFKLHLFPTSSKDTKRVAS